MQTVSSTYTSILNGSAHWWTEVKVNINNVDYDDSYIVDMTTQRSLFSGDSPSVGNAMAGELSLKMRAPSVSIPTMAVVKPYARITNGITTSEWIQKGEYFIDSRSTSKSGTTDMFLNITAYDAMLKAEQPFGNITGLEFPTTDSVYIQTIANLMGVQLDASIGDYITHSYSMPLYAGNTLRELLGYIGSAYAGNFIISDTGRLKFVPLDYRSADTVELGLNMQDFEYAPQFPIYDKIEVIVDDSTEYVAGSGDVSLECNCIFGTQAMANTIATALSTFRYQPMMLGMAVIHPAMEMGDMMVAGNVSSCICDWKIYFDSLFASDAAAPSDEEVNHEFKCDTSGTRKINRKLANFESELALQSEEISARVKVNDGNPQSFGWSLTPSKWEVKSNNSTVMSVDSGGLSVIGSLIAKAAASNQHARMLSTGYGLFNDLSVCQVFLALGDGYPYLAFGDNANTTEYNSNLTLFKMFSNGLWVGNHKPFQSSGAFFPSAEYAGIFINILEKKIYVVNGTEMRELWAGDSAAIFG